MNLKGLTKEQKIALLEALEEKERRAKTALGNYKPNAGQLEVHKSTKKTRLVVSGNGMGKTTLGVHEAMWAAQGFNPVAGTHLAVPRRVAVVLDRPDKVQDKWLPEIKRWFDLKGWSLNKNGKPYINQMVAPNGSEIKFFFHEMDELSFESLEVDDCIFDEPPPRKIYIALIRGMRNADKEARILIIGTPITGSWLRREIYEPWSEGELPDTHCFRFPTTVNKANLPPGYTEWFSSKLSEKERRIRIEGEFFDLDGLALGHLFERTKHILGPDFQFDKKFPCVVALDPHPSKKLTALLVGADQYGPVAIKELSLKMAPREFARHLRKWFEGYRVIDIICDSLGSAEMTGGEGFKSFIQVLNEEGVRARATTYADKNDEDWIARIQDVLALPETNNFGQSVPKLRIMPPCTGLINDIETVEWARYKNIDEFKPTLDISRKDFLACLKYALSTNITHKKEKSAVYYPNHTAYGVNLKKRAMQTIRMNMKRKGKL